MAAIDRPYKEALTNAIDIYREEMRAFLTRCLRRIPEQSVSEAIRQVLNDQQINDFDRSLQKKGDLESAIDVGHFPRLVQNFWSEVFSTEFREDKRTIVKQLRMIKKARDQVSHPPYGRDLAGERTREHLRRIARVLGSIRAGQAQKAVASILVNLDRAGAESRESAQRRTKQQAQAGSAKARMNWITGAAVGATALFAIAGSAIAFLELGKSTTDRDGSARPPRRVETVAKRGSRPTEG